MADAERINARLIAQNAVAAAQADRRREAEASKITDPRDVGGARAAQERLRILDELLPKEQALAVAQAQQAEIQRAIADNQAAEARVMLQAIGGRQEIAQLERDIANSVDKQLTLRQALTRLLAQQRQQGPANALDDTEARIERNRLLLGIRGLDPETRRAARFETRDLMRNVLPGQRLGAFDAARDVALAERAERGTGLAGQIAENMLRQRQEAVRGANVGNEAALFAIQQLNERLGLLNNIAASNVAGAQRNVDLTINLNVAGDRGVLSPEAAAQVAQEAATRVYAELTEGVGQAQLPPVIPVSGVRR